MLQFVYFAAAVAVVTSQMMEMPLTPTVPIQEDADCCYMSGTWRNQHGSVMVLNHTDDGVLTGEFMTAVESTHGASKGNQVIHGRVGNGRPTTFGFTVTFKDGQSTSSWSGQYHLCNGKETLMTTWVLTSSTKTCQEGWMATRIGQDEFTRLNQTQLLTRSEFTKKRASKKPRRKTNKKLRDRIRRIWLEKQMVKKAVIRQGKVALGIRGKGDHHGKDRRRSPKQRGRKAGKKNKRQ